jgi:hypothetical protein
MCRGIQALLLYWYVAATLACQQCQTVLKCTREQWWYYNWAKYPLLIMINLIFTLCIMAYAAVVLELGKTAGAKGPLVGNMLLSWSMQPHHLVMLLERLFVASPATVEPPNLRQPLSCSQLEKQNNSKAAGTIMNTRVHTQDGRIARARCAAWHYFLTWDLSSAEPWSQ